MTGSKAAALVERLDAEIASASPDRRALLVEAREAAAEFVVLWEGITAHHDHHEGRGYLPEVDLWGLVDL